jgi:hypothetical protein
LWMGVLKGHHRSTDREEPMRAALRLHSWMGLALLGWALVALARDRVVPARPVPTAKKPTPLGPVSGGESPPHPPVWN